MITENTILKINRIITNTQTNRSCAGCLSAYLYYDTIEEQISSIVYNLIKGHYFVDGNKRTAFVTFIFLCLKNGVMPLQNDYVKIFEDLASTRLSIKQVSEILFDK